MTYLKTPSKTKMQISDGKTMKHDHRVKMNQTDKAISRIAAFLDPKPDS